MKQLQFIIIFAIIFYFGVSATNVLKEKNDIKNNILRRRGFTLDVNWPITGDDIGKLLAAVNEEARPTGYSIGTPDGCEGGTLVSVMTDGQIHAFYYHATLGHTATAEGKTKPGRDCAEPGEWAHSAAMRDKHIPLKNKTFCSVNNYYKYCPGDASISSVTNTTNSENDLDQGSEVVMYMEDSASIIKVNITFLILTIITMTLLH
jgi:hypothetical protein